MASLSAPWNETGLSEEPAIQVLQTLRWDYVPPEVLDAERGSPRETVLERRLARSLRRLNPWLSDDNVHKVLRTGASPRAWTGCCPIRGRRRTWPTSGAWARSGRRRGRASGTRPSTSPTARPRCGG
ncbi:MAG TPA: hypothetical protein VEL74_17335 [Thermoanaerobaculia bacterium]|nr:hypothetical protein [Thermoanaerobaculia bacterium]